jgi:hypothetical protein
MPITNLEGTAYNLHTNNTHACNNKTVTKIYRAVIGTLHLGNIDTPTIICKAAVYIVHINSVS